jgi:hypothetical protein
VLAGLGTVIVVYVGAGLDFFGRAWGLHALIGGALLMIVGTQVLALGLCAHAYGTYLMGEKDPWFDRMRARFRLEHGLLLGGVFMLVGIVMGAVILATWIAHGFGSLADEHAAVVAASLLIVGIQIFFSSFLLSILGLRRRWRRAAAPSGRLSRCSVADRLRSCSGRSRSRRTTARSRAYPGRCRGRWTSPSATSSGAAPTRPAARCAHPPA